MSNGFKTLNAGGGGSLDLTTVRSAIGGRVLLEDLTITSNSASVQWDTVFQDNPEYNAFDIDMLFAVNNSGQFYMNYLVNGANLSGSAYSYYCAGFSTTTSVQTSSGSSTGVIYLNPISWPQNSALVEGRIRLYPRDNDTNWTNGQGAWRVRSMLGMHQNQAGFQHGSGGVEDTAAAAYPEGAHGVVLTQPFLANSNFKIYGLVGDQPWL